MGSFWICVLSFLTCVLLVVGGGDYPAEDLITKLPGQPEVNFRQFAGYVDVDLKNGRSLFYYFVEAEVNPNEKPLTLWLNGGPGCSSIGGGGFTELGPFFPQGDGLGLRRNSKSWNKVSNMLFVESPAGVGWSYSNTSSDYSTGDASTAHDILRFMVGWLKKFPGFRSRKLFLCGESYAGHYIPQLAIALMDSNVFSKGFKFNLAGILIGNPLLQSVVDFESKIDYLWSHGLISHEAWHAVKKNCHSKDFLSASPNPKTPSQCSIAKDAVDRSIGEYIDQYDVLVDICYPAIVEQQLRLRKWATKMSVGVDVCITFERRHYFNLPEVQKALHANRTNLLYQWTMCTDLINYRSADADVDILPLLKRIVQNKIPVWVYSGDEDTVIPLVGTRRLVYELARDLKFMTTIPYGVWFHEHQVGGWNIEYGKLLTFATVRGGGHMVPFSQPSRALQLFSSFVRNRGLPNSTHPTID